MPRNLRNFWIELEVDGRKTKIATGPPAKNGGFALRVFQRAGNTSRLALEVDGNAFPSGAVTLEVHTYWQTRRSPAAWRRPSGLVWYPRPSWRPIPIRTPLAG